jgi:hypothetical protein
LWEVLFFLRDGPRILLTIHKWCQAQKRGSVPGTPFQNINILINIKITEIFVRNASIYQPKSSYNVNTCVQNLWFNIPNDKLQYLWTALSLMGSALFLGTDLYSLSYISKGSPSGSSKNVKRFRVYGSILISSVSISFSFKRLILSSISSTSNAKWRNPCASG